MSLSYIVIIVKNPEDKKATADFGDVKVEYVSIGETFHGRHYKGVRPTHVIDQSGTLDWYKHLERGLTPRTKRCDS